MITVVQQARTSWWARRRHACLVSLQISLLVVAPAFVLMATLIEEVRQDAVAVDLRSAFLPAADAIRTGQSPYPTIEGPTVASGTAYVYPPPAAVALVPLTLLPTGIAVWVATVALIACVPLTLGLLGVRDWRCYGASFLWAPVLSGIQTANLSLPLMLLAAVIWRFRNRAAVSASALAAAVAAKLVLWPFALWFLATRRYRALLGTAALAAALVLGIWTMLEFAGLTQYPSLVRHLNDIEAPQAYTVYALALALHLPTVAAAAITGAAGASLLVACFLAGRRGADRRSFLLASGATLLLAPIAWLHYFALLLVPLAVAMPRFRPVWLAPTVLWVVPVVNIDRSLWQTSLVLLVLTVVLVTSLGRESGRRVGANASTVIEWVAR